MSVSTFAVIRSQAVYQLRTFTRSPVALFFSIGLPVVMLVLFNTLFGGRDVNAPQGGWPVSQFYTGGLAAFTAVSVSYTGLVNMMPVRRDEGVLKRWYSTPLSPTLFFSGWILSSLVVAAIGVALQLGIGLAFYGLTIDAGKLPALIVTFVVGVLSFSALGVGVAGLVPNSESAPAVANATILPLAFISDVFIPLGDAPRWLDTLGSVFPLKPFANSFQDTINPLVAGSGFNWSGLAVVAAWGVFGLVLARFTFRWQPSRSGSSRRRGRSNRRDHASA